MKIYDLKYFDAANIENREKITFGVMIHFPFEEN